MRQRDGMASFQTRMKDFDQTYAFLELSNDTGMTRALASSKVFMIGFLAQHVLAPIGMHGAKAPAPLALLAPFALPEGIEARMLLVRD